MAIWPFGRKNKRHTIHLDAAATEGAHLSHDPRHSLDDSKIAQKPTRAPSKRQKNRHSQPVDDYSHPYRNPTLTSSQQTQFALRSPKTDQVHPTKGLRDQDSRLGHHADGYTSYSTVCREPTSVSRNPSLVKGKQNGNGPAVLKKRLSKRKAYEIAREREIRMMASSPIDIPRRSLPGDPRHRRSDRHLSDLSLSIRDSAASSISEFSETYTFKVNGFAAWTPRPVIHYVEAPRAPSARSQKTPDGSTRRDKPPAITASEDKENIEPKKRVDRLADDLDAGGLRELLERDRRRKERKLIEDQEKLQRKLQQAAEQRKPDAELAPGGLNEHSNQTVAQNVSSRQDTESHVDSRADDDASKVVTNPVVTEAPSGSWLRDGSTRGTGRSALESMESVHVIGNLDDSSIRERKLGARSSFAPSQDMVMSRSTLSPSRSASRQGLHSPASSQLYGMGRESTSDVSRTVDSERRMSDHSAGHTNTITSIFRRGSSRLKRRYRERFRERSPEISSTSFESFTKISPPPSAPPQAPPPFIPPRAFIPTGTINRQQSKFTEHFGDEPLSPPDSRLQSPDIPEEPGDGLNMDIDKSESQIGTRYPIPGSERQNSWAGDSVEGDADNVPLSQSLASIDSEGSWMSGQFLRRISQRKSNPVRPSIGSLRNRVEGTDESPNDDDASAASANQAPVQSSSKITSVQGGELDTVDAPEKTEETWHDQIAKRPVLVTPSVRPKSTEGLLNNVRSLSPISAEAEFGAIEEQSAELCLADDDGHDQRHE
ncbi:hypothetical protein ATEIFO6365_0009035200 [Aspergillus terreus]|uniref:Uncharacterized protein n=1 Tax=Aspergillus terreus TaxID=33178 RepID=A0A5M3Z833_ASPTE|nr:hypothetical protein ATETN484_0011034700 [Aspergillus terreus]GFF18989.1 hypothetical protein ATEIFO6365_0009035200 [Aspergillus terreus]